MRLGSIRSDAVPSILVTEILQTPDLGPQEAQRRVARHQSTVSSQVTGRGGEVLLLVGRGCVSTLPDLERALDAARDLLSQPQRHITAQGRLRAALHSGELLPDTPAIAQPAVAEARRLLDLAGPNEILLSASVREALSQYPHLGARLQVTPISTGEGSATGDESAPGELAYRLPLASLVMARHKKRSTSIWAIAGAVVLAAMAALTAIGAALLLR